MSRPELVIDLDEFARNIEVARERITPAELMLVVKDDAYGHGLARIVQRAAAEGVRWFGAFDVRESVLAREAAGADARIFSWLSVGTDEIADALAADVDLGVGDAGFLEDIAAVCRTTGITARVHLKVDTGLHRNGIRPEDWDGVIERARAHESAGLLRVVGVWSHIAEASDAEDDAARVAFDLAVASAEAAGMVLEVRHLAASAASFARPEFRYDLARVGAFCYGIRPAGGPQDDELGIRPIATLIAPVSHIADHEVTAAIGSLHGLPSSLGKRGHLQHRGARAEIRQVFPGHTTLDSWTHVTLGEPVTVFGPDAASATDLAESIGTVGEEILVRVSPLVPRVYRGD